MLDGSCDAYLVFKINLKDMFAGAEGGEEDWAMPMRSFPRPVAQFDVLPGQPERLDLAVVPGSCGGTNIVAVSSDKRTVIYDAAAGAEVPCGRELRYCITAPRSSRWEPGCTPSPPTFGRRPAWIRAPASRPSSPRRR